MAISIKDPETERLARLLAKATGETITVATKKALAERLGHLSGVREESLLLEDLRGIRLRCASLPVIDRRTADEILGYNEAGLPT